MCYNNETMEHTERFFITALVLTLVFAGIGVYSWKSSLGETRIADTAASGGEAAGFESTPAHVVIYFGKTNAAANGSCAQVFPVPRMVTATNAVGLASLIELLKGPTPAETAAGYMTSINSNVDVHYLSVANGKAQVDFSDSIEKAVGGSCRVAAIRTQIEETLKQFPSITDVVISVDGRTADVLQP